VLKRRGIKNLIIDFGGVLIDLDRQRCLENFRKLGLPDVEVMLDLYHQQDFFQKYEKGLITSAEFRQTVVMITHNDDIARLADRIVRIEDGKIVE